MLEATFFANQISGSLIILNGASSAGKSSIAKVLQAKLSGDFSHVEMDNFLNGLPPIGDLHRQNAINDRLRTLANAVGERIENSQNIILDIVAWQKDISLYAKYRPYVVAIKPSLEVLEARERARGDRHIGTARSQLVKQMHEGILYDLEMDNSSLTAEQTANRIIEAFAKAKFAPAKPCGHNTRTDAPLLKNDKA